jgi:hypothetical protein
MRAKLVRTLPEGPDWEYELKLDGYRLQAIKDGDKVRLYSRRGNDFTRKFAKIASAVSKIKATSFILDGEAVAVDAQGKPSFQMLQNRALLPPGWSLASSSAGPHLRKRNAASKLMPSTSVANIVPAASRKPLRETIGLP